MVEDRQDSDSLFPVPENNITRKEVRFDSIKDIANTLQEVNKLCCQSDWIYSEIDVKKFNYIKNTLKKGVENFIKDSRLLIEKMDYEHD